MKGKQPGFKLALIRLVTVTGGHFTHCNAMPTAILIACSAVKADDRLGESETLLLGPDSPSLHSWGRWTPRLLFVVTI